MWAPDTCLVRTIDLCGIEYGVPEHTKMEAGELAPLGPIIQYPQGLPCHSGRYALYPVIRKSFRKQEQKPIRAVGEAVAPAAAAIQAASSQDGTARSAGWLHTDPQLAPDLMPGQARQGGKSRRSCGASVYVNTPQQAAERLLAARVRHSRLDLEFRSHMPGLLIGRHSRLGPGVTRSGGPSNPRVVQHPAIGRRSDSDPESPAE